MEENKNRLNILLGRGKGMHILRVLQLDIGGEKTKKERKKHTHQKPREEGSRT
jgi:hypothetical protein